MESIGRSPRDLPETIGASTACVTAVVGVAIGSAALLFQLAGVPSSVTRAVGTRVVNAAIAETPTILVTLQAEVAALSEAQGVYNQAKAVYNLFSTIGKGVPFSSLISAIKDELSWYQWVLLSVTVIAQLTLWFATGGTAAIAELVIVGAAVASLAISATNAYSVCNAPETGLAATVAQPGDFVSIDVGYGGNPVALLETGELLTSQSGGAWTSMNATVEDFSTGLPSPAFPLGQLWLIAQNGDADGAISYVDYETGHQNQTNGMASLISTADDGETWAIQSGGEAMRWDATQNQWMGTQGVFDQIAVSSVNLQWGLVLESPTNPQTLILQRTTETAWTNVAASPEATAIIQIATNAAGDLVCVTAENKVFQYVAEGSTWIPLGGNDLAAQSICIRDPKNAWLIDTTAQAQPLGPLQNPSDNPSLLQWDTEDVWDETKSTHLYLVNRAAQLVATCATDPAFQAFVQNQIQPGANEAEAGLFRQGLCQGLYDADFLPAYNDPNFLRQATWKSHFYDESTGLNYMGETAPTALSNGVEFWQKSLTFLQSGAADLKQGGYFLGLALHYFTDLTQPMHAANYTYLSSFPFGYHTDFEVYTMSQQAAVQPQPSVVGFTPGSVEDITELYQSTAEMFKQKYFPAIEQAHMYPSWKWSPGKWQDTVLPLIPAILNDSVSATSQLLYLYIEKLVGSPVLLAGREAVSTQS